MGKKLVRCPLSMKFIGITGGVGAGKSAVLSLLAEKPNTRVMLADEIAHELMKPETDCYQKIVEQFKGLDIFTNSRLDTDLPKQREFDRKKLAQIIFAEEKRRMELNAIVHPSVKTYVQNQYHMELERGQLDLLVLEAALLIEERYDEICDEIWYIYATEENRRKRLKESRGYSDEKISQIFCSQLSEEKFKTAAQVIIDNNGDLRETKNQIEIALRREADE